MHTKFWCKIQQLPIKEHINLTLIYNFVVGLIKSQLFIYISYYSRKFELKTVTLGHYDLLDWSEKPLGLDNPLVYTEIATHTDTIASGSTKKGLCIQNHFFYIGRTSMFELEEHHISEHNLNHTKNLQSRGFTKKW